MYSCCGCCRRLKHATTKALNTPNAFALVRLLHGCLCVVQAGHILGTGGRKTFSYLLGYGPNFPARPQHRLASCTGSSSGPFSVSTGLLSSNPNPVQLTGKGFSTSSAEQPV